MNIQTMKGKCLRKRRYANLDIAEKECKRISRESGKPFYVYWCRCCNGFHLTTKPRDSKYSKINIDSNK